MRINKTSLNYQTGSLNKTNYAKFESDSSHMLMQLNNKTPRNIKAI